MIVLYCRHKFQQRIVIFRPRRYASPPMSAVEFAASSITFVGFRFISFSPLQPPFQVPYIFFLSSYSSFRRVFRLEPPATIVSEKFQTRNPLSVAESSSLSNFGIATSKRPLMRSFILRRVQQPLRLSIVRGGSPLVTLLPTKSVFPFGSRSGLGFWFRRKNVYITVQKTFSLFSSNMRSAYPVPVLFVMLPLSLMTYTVMTSLPTSHSGGDSFPYINH